MTVPEIKPGRKIEGIAALLLPFRADGTPDLDGLATLLAKTRASGLQAAVNMDTGFGPEIGPALRAEIVRLARDVLDAPFVAGAMPFGHDGDPVAAYRSEVELIVDAGGTPIVFPSDTLSADPVSVIEHATRDTPRALAFELGTMFAPFGRIFDDDTFRRVMAIPNVVGLKHSSLDRRLEWRRLAMRDAERPDFRIYTGNDLAIDMVCYGSDYLLGLATFDVAAFAQRDAWWEASDPRFYALNDALQAVGAVAFREPVPAYKDSAATYVRVTGALPDPHPHPSCPRRGPGEDALLAALAARVEDAKHAG